MGLHDCGKEGVSGIAALEFQQASELTDAATTDPFLQLTDIGVEVGMEVRQFQFLVALCVTRLAKQGGMMAGMGDSRVGLVDEKSLKPSGCLYTESQTLLNQNQDLRVEVGKLRAQLKTREQEPEQMTQRQQSLFQTEP